jgi:hypothetical protein
MSNIYKVLKADSEFLTDALKQSQVDILELRGDLASCIMDCGGPVQKRSPVSVKVADAYYMRSEFELDGFSISIYKQIPRQPIDGSRGICFVLEGK